LQDHSDHCGTARRKIWVEDEKLRLDPRDRLDVHATEL
jgi:hypothetical protein